MPILVTRPSGVNIGTANPGNTAYFGDGTFTGNETTESSIRFIYDTGTDFIKLERRESGIWVPGSMQMHVDQWVVDSILGEFILDSSGQIVLEG